VRKIVFFLSKQIVSHTNTPGKQQKAPTQSPHSSAHTQNNIYSRFDVVAKKLRIRCHAGRSVTGFKVFRLGIPVWCRVAEPLPGWFCVPERHETRHIPQHPDLRLQDEVVRLLEEAVHRQASRNLGLGPADIFPFGFHQRANLWQRRLERSTWLRNDAAFAIIVFKTSGWTSTNSWGKYLFTSCRLVLGVQWFDLV